MTPLAMYRGSHELYGQRWIYFHLAVEEVGEVLAIPPSAAQTTLRKLCAAGQIRALAAQSDHDDGPFGPMPEPVPPTEWPDLDTIWQDVLVSEGDLRTWLDRQPTARAGGKQSRLSRLLAEIFPEGVPSRADRPREPLRAELLKRDPTLKPLDLKTLKTAIDAHNRQVGNTRNAGVSD
jgi:hypothetical protein